MNRPLICYESRDVIRERYDRRERVRTFWLCAALIVELCAWMWLL